MPKPDRQSSHISIDQATKIIIAANRAWMLDLPLNLHVIINWDVARLQRRVQDASSIFLRRFGDWCRNRDIPSAWIFVIENPPGGSLNQHIVLHLPEEYRREFSTYRYRWLAQAGAGSPRAKGSIKVVPVPMETEGQYLDRVEDLIRYLLKGSEPAFCTRNGIDHKFQGTIAGKRSGVAEVLGNSAIKLRPSWPRLIFPRLRMPSLLDERIAERTNSRNVSVGR